MRDAEGQVFVVVLGGAEHRVSEPGKVKASGLDVRVHVAVGPVPDRTQHRRRRALSLCRQIQECSGTYVRPEGEGDCMDSAPIMSKALRPDHVQRNPLRQWREANGIQNSSLNFCLVLQPFLSCPDQKRLWPNHLAVVAHQHLRPGAFTHRAIP